jgi:predicted Zn-dependent protease
MPYSEDYKLRFESANRLREEGDADGAIRVLSALVADFPNMSAAYLVIGDILWDEGKLPAASAAFRLATRHFPKIARLSILGTFFDFFRGAARQIPL